MGGLDDLFDSFVGGIGVRIARNNFVSIIRGGNMALEGLFLLLKAAHDTDPEATAEIIGSDDRAIEKLKRLNEIVIDGEEEEDAGSG